MTGDEPRFHRSLERQLRRLGLTVDAPPTAKTWEALLELVSVAYDEADA